jgi:hypothetical protein
MNPPTQRRAIWRNQDHDQPVTVIGELGEIDGVKYYAITESIAGIPAHELEFAVETEDSNQ